MTHNGHTDAIEKIKALEAEKQAFLRRVNASKDAEVAIGQCLHRNGYMEGSITRKRILFHVSRIMNESRIQERIRFEKAVEAI